MSHKIPQSVLVVIHTPALEVLLIERADAAGFWQSVTGSKDTLAESWFDTAVREVHEETGLDALAFVKGVLVCLDFLELRHAPALWRWLVVGWLALVLALILLAYWVSLR